MTWQIVLSVWIVVQMIGKAYRHVNENIATGQNKPMHIGSSIIGSVLWAAGMFGCLYMGGFYN